MVSIDAETTLENACLCHDTHWWMWKQTGKLEVYNMIGQENKSIVAGDWTYITLALPSVDGNPNAVITGVTCLRSSCSL